MQMHQTHCCEPLCSSVWTQSHTFHLFGTNIYYIPCQFRKNKQNKEEHVTNKTKEALFLSLLVSLGALHSFVQKCLTNANMFKQKYGFWFTGGHLLLHSYDQESAKACCWLMWQSRPRLCKDPNNNDEWCLIGNWLSLSLHHWEPEPAAPTPFPAWRSSEWLTVTSFCLEQTENWAGMWSLSPQD